MNSQNYELREKVVALLSDNLTEQELNVLFESWTQDTWDDILDQAVGYDADEGGAWEPDEYPCFEVYFGNNISPAEQLAYYEQEENAHNIDDVADLLERDYNELYSEPDRLDVDFYRIAQDMYEERAAVS